MPSTTVEIMPGEIWESIKGKHVGRRVEIIRDSGTSVKAKVLRGYGASSGDKHAGSVWSIERGVFTAMFRQVGAEPDNNRLKPVETDLGKLLETMPKPLVVNPINLDREVAALKQKPSATGDMHDPANRDAWYQREAEAEREMLEERVITTAEADEVDRMVEQAIEKAQKTEPVHDEKWQRKWDSLHSPEGKAKRAAALQARVDALTQAERDEIKRLRFEMHESVSEIARAYHLGFPETARLLKELHGEVEQHTAVQAMTANGRTVVLVGKNGRNFSAEGLQNISNTAHEVAARQVKDLSEAEQQAIADQYINGADFTSLMVDHHLIAGAVSQILRSHGVDISKKSRNARQAARKKAQRNEAENGVGVMLMASTEVRSSTEKPWYRALVMEMRPVEVQVNLTADSMEDALAKLKQGGSVIRVMSISEASGE